MRHMHGNGARVLARGVLTAALCAPLALAAGAQAEEGGTPSPPSSSQASFEDLYARLMAGTDGSKPPASVVTAAGEIRFSLTTDLIRSDAEIEVLKLEAARFGGERQRQALDSLVRAAAARERRLWLALRQLERLTGEPAPAVDEAPDASGDAPRIRGVEISFEPADVTEADDP